jgi:hypothetical protein
MKLMANTTEQSDGGVRVELTDDEMVLAQRLAEERLAVPIIEAIEVDRFTTKDGYEIVDYEHRRVYPQHLTFQGIVPGQTEEDRGWPCPRCGSTDTSAWGVTTVIDHRSFECRDCEATGDWIFECARRPSPVHLHDECACAPDCGCEHDAYFGYPMPKGRTTPSSDTVMTVPMEHRPGCSAAGR